MNAVFRTAVLAGVATVLLGAMLAIFSANPWPATFADDSASYLIKALAISPYGEASIVYREASRIVQLPPLFSWLLALTGTANSVFAAHLLVAAINALAMLAFWLWARSKLPGGEIPALLLTCLAIATPGFWVGSLGILSEGTYALISMVLLWRFPSAAEEFSTRKLFLIIVLSVLAVLSRSVGIALLLAWPVWLLAQRARWRQLLPPLFAFLLIAVFQANQESSLDWYAEQGIKPVLERTFLGVDNGTVDLWTVLLTNLTQLSSGWRENLLGAALAARIVPSALGLMVGLLALIGTWQRARQRHFDAIYLVFYLLFLLVWPYPGEQSRFLLPVMPLLLANTWALLRQVAANDQRELARLLLVGMLLLTLFSNLYSVQWRRLQLTSGEQDRAYITDFYRQPSARMGNYYAATYLKLMRAMKTTGEVLPAGSRVLTVKGNFFTLLSGLDSSKLLGPDQRQRQICLLAREGTTHAFVSRLTSYWNREGLATADRFRPLASDQIPIDERFDDVILLELDQRAVHREIARAQWNCDLHPD